MSKPDSSSHNIPKIALKPGKSPAPVALIIKKDKSITLRGNETKKFMENFKFSPQSLKTVLFKEDVIYESRPDDFLKGNPLEKVIIVNMLDRLANSSRTVARYYSTSTNEVLRELSSDNVVKVIGQNNYDTVFSALCSVINLESKVRGILSLLSPQQDTKDNSVKCELIEPPKSYKDECCQTEENCMDLLLKYQEGKKKRVRRSQLNPYVVTENSVKPQKRIIIETTRKVIKQVNMGERIESQSSTKKPQNVTQNETAEHSQIETLPDLRSLLNEDSNCSIGNLSVLSNFSADNLLEIKNPNELLKSVERFTNTNSKNCNTPIKSETGATEQSMNRDNWHKIRLLDGKEVKVPIKPEDEFHIATPEILQHVSKEDRVKLLYYQAYIDWKFCLQEDADGYLPIHMAVINDDVDMLRRQCFVLHNLDVVASELTPLQMALLQDTPNCGALVTTLLRYGADPLLTDNELRSPAHMAAEAPSEALQALLSHYQKQARSILENHEELWKPEYASKSDEELSRTLLDHVCKAFDGQGYTPLMLASRHGLHRNAQLLLQASPSSVNTQTPNAGDTALYLAVGAACMHAIDRGNRLKVADHFKATITALVESGADPFLQNLAGSNVNDLLSENSVPELSILIGTKITSIKFFDGKMPEDVKNCGAYMLENNAGAVCIKEFGDGRKSRGTDGVKTGIVRTQNTKMTAEIVAKKAVDNNANTGIGTEKGDKAKEKPIILENIELPKLDCKPSNVVFVNNSNVKFIKPQDKLEKVYSNTPLPTTSSVSNISNANSNVALQNIPKLNVSSHKSFTKISPSGKKKYVVVNVSHSSIVGNTTLNSNFKIVNTNIVKRKTTQDGPCNKKQKTDSNTTGNKNT